MYKRHVLYCTAHLHLDRGGSFTLRLIVAHPKVYIPLCVSVHALAAHDNAQQIPVCTTQRGGLRAMHFFSFLFYALHMRHTACGGCTDGPTHVSCLLTCCHHAHCCCQRQVRSLPVCRGRCLPAAHLHATIRVVLHFHVSEFKWQRLLSRSSDIPRWRELAHCMVVMGLWRVEERGACCQHTVLGVASSHASHPAQHCG